MGIIMTNPNQETERIAKELEEAYCYPDSFIGIAEVVQKMILEARIHEIGEIPNPNPVTMDRYKYLNQQLSALKENA